jgi:GNAT superfamily N-acetyltransferase
MPHRVTTQLDLRPLAPDCPDVLAAIDPRFLSDAGYLRRISALAAIGMSWVAFDAQAPAGFAIVTDHFYGFPFVDILHVTDARRRGGIGRRLMEHCEAVHCADRIFTSTNESNSPMRALLARAGWLGSGRIDYLDPGDPELVFVKLREG